MSTANVSDINRNSRENEARRQRGQGRIILRGQTWWIQYWRRGRQIRESSKSNQREEAEKLLARRMKEIWAERSGMAAFAPRAEKIYIDELLDELEQNYKLEGGRAFPQFLSHLKPIREAFADLRAVNLTVKMVNKYREQRLEDGKAPATINRETSLLTEAFRLAKSRDEIVRVPVFGKLKEHNVRQGFFEQFEFDAVVAHLPGYLQDFARFAHLCAWRKGQIRKLTWLDVDRMNQVIIARASNVKNEHDHKLTLEGELAEIVERRWAAREYDRPEGRMVSKYVFHREGRPVGDFRKAWATACAAAGIVKPKLDKAGNPVMKVVDGKEQPVMEPARLFHDLRRTGVRNMVRAGVREGVAMAISGHRTRAVFDRYNITSEDDLRQALKQTQEHLEQQSAARKIVSLFTKK